MASGIKPSQEVVDAVTDVVKHRAAWAICGFNDSRTKVVVIASGQPGSPFSEFKSHFKKEDALYMAYDCKYTLSDGGAREKVLAVSFSDDDHCKGKDKMLVASTLPEMKSKVFRDLKVKEIKDHEEITEENFINIVSDNKSR